MSCVAGGWWQAACLGDRDPAIPRRCPAGHLGARQRGHRAHPPTGLRRWPTCWPAETIDAVLMGAEWIAANGDTSQRGRQPRRGGAGGLRARHGRCRCTCATPDHDLRLRRRPMATRSPQSCRPAREIGSVSDRAGSRSGRTGYSPAQDVIPAARISGVRDRAWASIAPADTDALAAAYADPVRTTQPPRPRRAGRPRPPPTMARPRRTAAPPGAVDDEDEARRRG